MKTLGARAAALFLMALGVGCARSAPHRQPSWRGPGPNPAAPGYAAAPAPPRYEAFRPGAPRQAGSAFLVLPGSRSPRLVQYATVGGTAVMEGDIVLGPAHQLAQRYGIWSGGRGEVKGAMAVSNNAYLWPGGVIPYEFHASISPSMATEIQWAIDAANATELEYIPRRPTDTDWVVFQDVGEGCNSHAGRIGGPQTINVSNCFAGRGSVLHEMMHAAGFFHEQSRTDRDAFVTIVWEEIDPAFQHAFQREDSVGRDIGPYDYGSIMHYTTDAFSRTGRPTIITKVPNTPIGQREGLSALDRAAITALYGAGGGATPTGPVPGLPPIPGLPQIPNLPLPPGWSLPLPSGAEAPPALPLPGLFASP